jgi:hypothetical protein
MSDLDRASTDAIEPSVGELLLYKQALEGIEKAGVEELRKLAGILARQVLVVHPAATRWLAREAAGSLSRHWKGGDALVAELGLPVE